MSTPTNNTRTNNNSSPAAEDPDDNCIYTWKQPPLAALPLLPLIQIGPSSSRGGGGGSRPLADLPSSFFQFFQHQQQQDSSSGAQQRTPGTIPIVHHHNHHHNLQSSSSCSSSEEDFIEGDLPDLPDLPDNVVNNNLEEQQEEERQLLLRPPPIVEVEPPPPPLPLLPVWQQEQGERFRIVKISSRQPPQPPPPPPPPPIVIQNPCSISNNEDAEYCIIRDEPPENKTTTETLIWTTEQARKYSSIQALGPSSCGLQAVLNALTSLHHPTTGSQLSTILTPNLRDHTAPLHQYLLSRSRAGTTAIQLIHAVESVTQGKVFGKFFKSEKELTGERLGQWLTKWIVLGCTPLATLNPQAIPVVSLSQLPDAWHHQMIFGVSTNASKTMTTTTVHLTNPLESISAEVLLQQLLSESVLLVRRDDVLSRVGDRTDLRLLTRFEDPRWNEMNVLGSVSHILHEEQQSATTATQKKTPHLPIPADYVAGISLFIQKSSGPTYDLLSNAYPFIH